MKKFNRMALLCLLSFGLCGAAGAGEADPKAKEEFRHEIRVMGRLGNHPNVVHFIGAVTTGVSFTSTAVGDNPLYQDQGMAGDNPLYSVSGEPGTPGAIQSISFELDNTTRTPFLHAEGVVHRDIAARNFLITTNQGTYESAPGEILLFENDGPPTLEGNRNVGPIRWMAPESLRLHRAGSTDPDDWIEIVGGESYFDVNYVPEPSSLGLVALGVGLLMRRR